MKTTIDISDPLLEEAKTVAAREGVTLRTLVERGLRLLLSEGCDRPPYRLPDTSFKGRGLQADLADATWDEIRERAYEGRGG